MVEYLQVLERKNGRWSNALPLQSGFSESWVIDKTTDSAKDIIVRPNYEPDWDIMDWVRIIHVPEPVVDPIRGEYGAEGLPMNHTQYIIANIKKEHIPMAGIWKVFLELAEPIERLNGVIGETLTYTNQTRKTQDGVTYIKDPYNHYTALERWLKVTPANCDTYQTGYDRKQNISWFNRIKILDEDWLKTIPFTDATFNELSLYNLFMDVYDASTGRTPVLYFDINPDTDLPYNLARDEYILKFERQDGFDKPILEFEELKANCISMSETQTWDNYATGLVSNAENISASSRIEFPAQGLYAVPEVLDDVKRNTTSFNAPGENWVIRFPHPIKRILKLQRLNIDGLTGASSIYHKRETADLTNKVFERKQYLALDTAPENNNDVFWYEEGGHVLHIKEYYYDLHTPDTNMYYIEYEPLISCRLMVGDVEYQHQINQTASQIDATKYSSFLNSYLAGMKKADVVIIKHYTDFDQFAHHFGCRVNRNGKTYMITAMSYIGKGCNSYEVYYQLNENHVRKNNNYQASQEIRTDIAIEMSNIRERKTAIKQTLKLGLTPQTEEGNQFLKEKIIALSALNPGTVNSKYYPQIALLYLRSFLRKQGDPPNWQSGYAMNRLASLAKFQFGNQINFNVRFFDNAEAGKKKTFTPHIIGEGAERPFMDIDSQIPILYTDPFGEVQYVNFWLSALTTGPLANYSAVDELTIDPVILAEMNKAKNVYTTMANLPVVSAEMFDTLTNNSSVRNVPAFNLLKDQLETFNLNIVVDYFSNDIIICKDLIKLSRLLKQTDEHEGIFLRMFDINKSEYDNDDGLLAEYEVNNITAGNGFIEYSFTPYEITDEKSIIITTENGNKLLILNNLSDTIKTQLTNGKLKIYFA